MVLSGHELFVFLPHLKVNFNISDSKSRFSFPFHETLRSFIVKTTTAKLWTTGLLVCRLIDTVPRSYWSVKLVCFHADVCRLTAGCVLYFPFSSFSIKSFSRMKPWSFPPSHQETFSAVGFRCCHHKRVCCSNNEWKQEIK